MHEHKTVVPFLEHKGDEIADEKRAELAKKFAKDDHERREIRIAAILQRGRPLLASLERKPAADESEEDPC